MDTKIPVLSLVEKYVIWRYNHVPGGDYNISCHF